MSELLLLLIIVPILLLGGVAAVPSRWAAKRVRQYRQWAVWVAGLQFVSAFLAAVVLWAGATGSAAAGAAKTVAASVGLVGPLGISVYYDGVSSLMLLLVSFVGLIVCRFSVRYLDGEPGQGRYFRGLTWTIGAVSAVVVAGNLGFFWLAWLATSWGLHRLLLFYPQRPGARRAAWTKFAVSRLGDACLLAAIVLTYFAFGTLQFSEIFDTLRVEAMPAATAVATASTSEGPTGGLPDASSLAMIAWLLVVGAATKSAQFPFHTWLPETMETPTPVSALMHAGIVNAGGYLVIRLSPLVTTSSAALAWLAVVGAFTACYAGIVMLTQSSIKRGLAYSTIAQMGFMMLQCGLGAFSAAMLHILAHSLYKAHAFLSSGSVLAQAQSVRGARWSTPTHVRSIVSLGVAATWVVGCYLAANQVLGMQYTDKPGGGTLAVILCLALVTWAWRVIAVGPWRVVWVGSLLVAALSVAYLVSYLAVDHLVGPSLPTAAAAWSNPLATQIAVAGIVVAFALLFALHWTFHYGYRPAWLEAIYVHALNGFYLDALLRRLFTRWAVFR